MVTCCPLSWTIIISKALVKYQDSVLMPLSRPQSNDVAINNMNSI